ncbi:hypothetical protein NLG97_g10528 [Lecanicillium saksenae]|uniref:Uncharacterized protein n=1 Tax=Lecanicillium saksenae TaxID=468837 RepID=A0ACC1QEM2_9HYPO|nr:hypothetical protein NLG97_g10528 [Lecanicillium saksenae]
MKFAYFLSLCAGALALPKSNTASATADSPEDILAGDLASGGFSDDGEGGSEAGAAAEPHFVLKTPPTLQQNHGLVGY